MEWATAVERLLPQARRRDCRSLRFFADADIQEMGPLEAAAAGLFIDKPRQLCEAVR